MNTERIFLWSLPVLVLGALAALSFWPASEEPQPVQLSAPAPKPAIRYPVQPHEPPADSLPTLADSDGVIADALVELFGRRLPEFVYL